MLWSVLVATLGLASAVTAINRPVHKVILTQKGFTQFLQYDVETPPIREFTFCTWLKLYGFQNEQSIFTYIVNGDKRVVRLWLDSGGRHLKVLFNERELSSVLVDLGTEVWRHVCLSYQSDFGAWALYLDSRLISCEASQGLQFFVISGGGSVILGYGTTEQGNPTGLEGEIFGANMLLSSTIGRNYSIQNHPLYLQKTFHRNKIRASKNIDYVVLNDLDTDGSPNIAKETKLPARFNKSNSFIKVQTPYSYIHHAIGIKPTTMQPIQSFGSSASHESEILELVMNPKPRPTVVDTSNTWKFLNTGSPTEKLKIQDKPGNELSSSDTRDFLMVSEYETPPPLQSARSNLLQNNFESEKLPHQESIFKVNDNSPIQPYYNKKAYHDDISEIEVPPPPEKNTKVYGQWTSSKYAGSVLNYLKSINYYNKDKKVPQTIPLSKVSNNFPYPSNFNTRIVRPPTNLQKRNMLAEKRLQDQYHPSSLRRIHKYKREIKIPQINVKIVEDDIREEILKSHAKAHPMHVKVTNRGETQKIMTKQQIYEDQSSLSDNHRVVRNNDNDVHQSKKGYSLFNVLPFLKSFEYFTGDSDDHVLKVTEDMYAKSFSTANKWHNIKTYNNDYTPRRVPGADINNEQNERHPAIRLKYRPESHKVVHLNNDEPLIKGRQLAKDVSNQSENNKDKVSILKYNHGFLPGHSEVPKTTKSQLRDAELRSKSEFHKHVKIGNALNERNLIGKNNEEKKHSFLGGDEKIPDINRYRSDIDNEKHTNVPPSLKPKVCKNVELLDHLLYVHPDGSIKMSQIVSPIQTKNIALEFVIQNYKKCSLHGSPLEDNFLLLIDWNKTPVRLFGGAIAKRTKDLCGFF